MLTIKFPLFIQTINVPSFLLQFLLQLSLRNSKLANFPVLLTVFHDLHYQNKYGSDGPLWVNIVITKKNYTFNLLDVSNQWGAVHIYVEIFMNQLFVFFN